MKTVVSVGDNTLMMTHVVTVFLRNRGAVLLSQHTADAETTPGRWDGLSAPIQGDSDAVVTEARRLVRETLGQTRLRLAYAGEQLSVSAGGRERTVHPVLFDTPTRDVDIDLSRSERSFDTVEWVSPTAILDRKTVPGLWEAYQQVAASVTTVAADTVHGSAAISIHALEVLRDRAAVADEWESVVEVARELQAARPSMAVLANRINRVMSGADRSPTAVHDRALDAIEAACDADSTAAATAADRLEGPIATLSWSGTVRDTLLELGAEVTVAESRPDFEGIELAEALSAAGIDVTVTTDVALVSLLSSREFGAVLVGADTILPKGDVINKTGTRALALAADRVDVPVYVVAARDKVATDDTFHPEFGPDAAVYDGPEPVSVVNPIFDLTPGDLIDGVITEDGLLDQRGITVVTAQHRSNTDWLAEE